MAREISAKDRINEMAARAITRFQSLHRLATYASQIVGAPVTHDLYQAAREFVADGRSAADALIPGSGAFADEFDEVRLEILGRFEKGRAFPTYFDVGPGTSEWLYCIVRAIRPATVVEVGVAEGFSTAAILAGLDANQCGRLISVDIVPDVGGLVKSHPRWDLRIHQPKASAKQLNSLLDGIADLDLFFHDAGHHYLEQYDDYLSGLSRLRRGGVFMSDDVDFSWAFLELCRRLDLRPIVLGEGRKEAGGFVKA